MFVYCSLKPPCLWRMGTKYPQFQIRLGSVAAASHQHNCLDRVVWDVAGKYHAAPEWHDGTAFIPGLELFLWAEGVNPELEAVAHDRDGGLLPDSDSLIEYLKQLSPATVTVDKRRTQTAA